MDDFGMLARDFGFRPQGKSAPMKSPVGSDGGDRRNPSLATSSSPLAGDQHNRDNLLFNDVFGGPPKYTTSNNKPSTMSDFDYDSIFKSSAPANESKNKSTSSVPVYDKPVYDNDIFDGLPGLKSKPMSASARYDENVFASTSSPLTEQSGGDHFDDLLGNLGKMDKVEPRKNTKTSRDFEDLIPGFGSDTGSGSLLHINRPTPNSVRTHKSTATANSNQNKTMDDPFVVLESTLTPGVSSSGFVNDPLKEINELSNSGSIKADGSSLTGGVFDDIDPLNGFGKSVPANSSEMNSRGKDRSPSRSGSKTRRAQNSTTKETIGHSVRQSQKKAPGEDFQDSHQTLFGIPNDPTESQKSFGQRASSPSFKRPNFNETTSHVDMSPRSEENMQPSDDVWLTVSEIPLFTQPTRAPPPSRTPPPVPRYSSKSERGFDSLNARKKSNDISSSLNSAQYSHSPKSFRPVAKDPVVSSIDEDFVMTRNWNSANESVDAHSGEDTKSNSAAAASAASAAAMKEAMDRAEAKFRHAKEVREKEAKAARSKDTVQLENDELQGTPEDEFMEKQERIERERQQMQREEEERERRRLEKERAREVEWEKARQAVERATREARERAAMEARERAAADARLKSERAAVQRAQAEARERAAAEARERAERAAAEARERADAEARERANAEAREKEAQEKAAVASAEADARRRAERAAVNRAAAEARERAAAEARVRAAAARANQQKNDNDLESFFSMGSRPSSAPRPRENSSDPSLDPQSQSRRGPEVATRTSSSGVSSNMKKTSSTNNIVDDLSSIFGAAPSAGEFQDLEGETEERRRARLERHQRTQERTAKALAEKNQRDLQTQRDQEERHSFAETLDIEIKRWAAGKEGNLRALLSTLQYVLWPECGWQPVSLTDLITGASVKKVYRKATLCIHPDKVQQKGANLQQKYIAEKVFDLLKEAWNKLNSEELF